MLGTIWDSLRQVQVSPFKRNVCTHVYVAGTVGTDHIREVSIFRMSYMKGSTVYIVHYCMSTAAVYNTSI